MTTGIAAGPGGVMTVEVGVITGELTLRTAWDGRFAILSVQYDGAAEWYAVEGSPVPALDRGSVQAVHEAMTAAICRGAEATAQGLVPPGPPTR
ncbi:hypothetical protein AB0A71_41210 [Kitasatospora aureofaciens]|uniref:hypothetical protein n=1 Tax=Kitasatospora aureofaciens TaxID=1894 RepID=UPI0033E87003